MIYRTNPALPVSGASPAAVATHLICEGVVRRLAEDPGFERDLALHVLDAATTSGLLHRAAELAALVASRLPDLARAPIGSARRQARDRGGRIASAIGPWVDALGRQLDGMPSGLPLDPRARKLWDLAHPEAGHALRCVSDAASTLTYRDLTDAEIRDTLDAITAAVDVAEIRPPEAAVETAAESDDSTVTV